MKHFVMTAVTPLAVPGDSAGTTCRDARRFSTEPAYPLNKALSVGLDYSYRQGLPESQDAAGEAAAHFNYRFSHGHKLQLHAVAGYAKSSLDWRGGASAAFPFQGWP